MHEETNDKIPENPGKSLPGPLDIHLRNIMAVQNLDSFREQLPAEFLSDASEGLGQVKDARQL